MDIATNHSITFSAATSLKPASVSGTDPVFGLFSDDGQGGLVNTEGQLFAKIDYVHGVISFLDVALPSLKGGTHV